MKVIAFIGRAGSGKDYQCSILQKQGYKKLAFADPLRKIAFNSLGISYETGMKNYDWLKSNEFVNVVDLEGNVHSFNFRTYLETLGTQGIRVYDPNFWIRCMIKEIEECTTNVCISDMRFPNEYLELEDYCKKHKIDFKVYFCDYHSERYQDKNTHESARLSNELVEAGYKDLQEITTKDIYDILLSRRLKEKLKNERDNRGQERYSQIDPSYREAWKEK